MTLDCRMAKQARVDEQNGMLLHFVESENTYGNQCKRKSAELKEETQRGHQCQSPTNSRLKPEEASWPGRTKEMSWEEAPHLPHQGIGHGAPQNPKGTADERLPAPLPLPGTDLQEGWAGPINMTQELI